MSIEAMKQALEALDGLSEPYDVLKAQDALRQAIEQAENQEPVECMCGICKLGKREWVGLTEEDKEAIYEEYLSSPQSFTEITEAKLKEKNT